MQVSKKRFLLIDAVRGFALINMILYHLCYDIFILYGYLPGWTALPSVRLWERIICCTFILVSGISWRWGKQHNLRRGIVLNIWGIILTAVTWLVVPDSLILFGILNFIGCAILLLLLLQPLFKRIPPWIGCILCLVLFFFFYPLSRHYLGFGNIRILEIPGSLYESGLLTPLGFPHPGFVSSDFFPILPWFFLFCAGYFLEPLLTARGFLCSILRCQVPLLTEAGQKSLLIYLLHQPVCMLLCMLFLS